MPASVKPTGPLSAVQPFEGVQDDVVDYSFLC